MFSRRALLLGTTSTLAVGAAGGVGIQQGVLPGRPWLQRQLGLDGAMGSVPDVEPGPVERGSFVSAARLGAPTRWALARPPGITGPLPLVVALHAHGHDVETLLGPGFGLPEHLAAAVAAGAPPFQLAMADGGTTYWHERQDGEDAGAMIVDELLPLLQERDIPTEQVGLIGWSMGGFGALHLAGMLGSDRVPAAVATSAAIWTDGDDATPSAFDDEAEWAAFTPFGRQDDLGGITLRLDCGTGDPFYRAVEDYVEGFPADADVTATFEPGGHTAGYWRRVLPAQLAFLGAGVASPRE